MQLQFLSSFISGLSATRLSVHFPKKIPQQKSFSLTKPREIENQNLLIVAENPKRPSQTITLHGEQPCLGAEM